MLDTSSDSQSWRPPWKSTKTTVYERLDPKGAIHWVVNLIFTATETHDHAHAPTTRIQHSILQYLRSQTYVSNSTSQQHASVSQGRTCTDNFTCCHTDRSCRANFLPHPVTVYWHQADQSQRWPYNATRLAGWPLECQFLRSHWYDSTPKKSRRKRFSNPGSSTLKADTLTTRPMRRSTHHVHSTLITTICTVSNFCL